MMSKWAAWMATFPTNKQMSKVSVEKLSTNQSNLKLKKHDVYTLPQKNMSDFMIFCHQFLSQDLF